MTGADAEPGETDAESLRRAYEVAVARLDMDAVHTLIARHGLSILNNSLPYLVVAARRDKIDQVRSARNRREVSTAEVLGASVETEFAPTPEPDRSDLDRLADAMSRLEPHDATLLVQRAKGLSYAKIAASMNAADKATTVSSESLRQRHRRALERLRNTY